MSDHQKKTASTDSIVRKRIGSNLAYFLVNQLTKAISPSELSSLLLMVYERVVADRKVSNVFQQYCNDQFVQPSHVSQKAMTALDNLMFQIVPDDFESLELSPVAPLGINAILANINQKNVLSATRNTEVSADITSVLALECAKRRKHLMTTNPKSFEEVRLCGSQRSLRTQSFDDKLGFTSHFRVFGLASAGRDVGYEKFESANLTRHIEVYLAFLDMVTKSSFFVDEIEVAISDIRLTEALITHSNINRDLVRENTQNPDFDLLLQCGINADSSYYSIESASKHLVDIKGIAKPLAYLAQIESKAVHALRSIYPNVRIVFDLARVAGIRYYESLCFKITAKNREGVRLPLVDGGLVGWSRKILASRKKRLLISGFGTEFFCQNYTLGQ